MDNDMKIKDILNKLNISCCPLAGKGKDQWLTDILFKPSFERYNLIKWILDQLGINVSEMSEDESSSESKIESFKATLSAIGVCSADDSNVIEGTASLKKQLHFWDLLCCMLSKRNELIASSVANSDSNNSDYKRNISKQFETSCDYIAKACQTVNFFDLFDRKLQLFPAHVNEEVKKFSDNSLHDDFNELPEHRCSDLKEFFQKSDRSVTMDEVKQNYFEKFGTPRLDTELNDVMDVINKNIELNEYEEGVIPEENELKKVEDNISKTLSNLENASGEFKNAYESLKPFLANVSPEEFIDIGPAFKTTEIKLNSVSQLRDSATTLKSLDTELEKLSSKLSEYQISSGYLSDDKLGEYLEVLSNTEEKH